MNILVNSGGGGGMCSCSIINTSQISELLENGDGSSSCTRSNKVRRKVVLKIIEHRFKSLSGY